MFRGRSFRCSLAKWGLVVLLASAASASEEGHVAAGQVSVENYTHLMDNWLFTHDGDSRGPSGAEHDPARDNILELFLSYGLEAELHEFTSFSGPGENVIATQWGTIYPDQEIVIGAHYDSVSNPGADDNASGVALVLEAARIISQYPSQYTIRYMAYDLEELGLLGAEAYVADHADDDIIAMISADMVAYDPDTNLCRIYRRTTSPVADALADAVEEYGDGLTWMDAGWIGASNHAAFDSGGIDACLLIEGSVWDNPHYHSPQDSFDTPGYLNFPYAVRMTRSIVGWLVDSAGVQLSPLFIELPEGTPWRIDPDAPTTILVEISNGSESYVPDTALLHYRYDDGPFQTAPLTFLSGNHYAATLPPAACDDVPQYYVSAIGDGGSTITSPELAPLDTYTALVATMTTHLKDDFETDQAWIVENVDLESGAWERGVPVGDGSRGDPTRDHDGSGQCYLTGNAPGNTDVDGGPTRLISPALDLSDAEQPVLTFACWISCDDPVPPSQDVLEISVSGDDGASWVLVETVSHTGAWIAHDVQLAEYLAPTEQMRLMFSVMDSPNNSVTEAGVDAIHVYDLSCASAPPLCAGDMNCDGLVNFDDIDAFVAALNCPNGTPNCWEPACPWLNGDCDGDEDVTFDDIDPFVTRIGAECD